MNLPVSMEKMGVVPSKFSWRTTRPDVADGIGIGREPLLLLPGFDVAPFFSAAPGAPVSDAADREFVEGCCSPYGVLLHPAAAIAKATAKHPQARLMVPLSRPGEGAVLVPFGVRQIPAAAARYDAVPWRSRDPSRPIREKCRMVSCAAPNGTLRRYCFVYVAVSE